MKDVSTEEQVENPWIVPCTTKLVSMGVTNIVTFDAHGPSYPEFQFLSWIETVGFLLSIYKGLCVNSVKDIQFDMNT